MKKIKCIILFLFISLLTCSCDYKYASFTRDIRHSGYNISNSEFRCDSIFSNSSVKDHVKYYLGSSMITESGLIYKISISKPYSNKMNCMKSNFKMKFTSIMDFSVGRGNDGKLYYLAGNNDVKAFSEVLSSDDKLSLYTLLLGDSDVKKVVTVNGDAGIFYVLKSDGNVYMYNVAASNGTFYIDYITMVYDSNDFKSRIVDFYYNGESSITYIKTENSYFRMLVSNLDECSKYADVDCNYDLKYDKGLSNSYDKILAYNGSSLITNYGKIFTVSN